MARLREVRVHRVRVPLVGHFTTAVRSATELETVLVEAIDSDGFSGWGEAPISKVTRLSTEQAVASIEGPLAALVLHQDGGLHGTNAHSGTGLGGALPGELSESLARLEQSTEPPAARMAMDCALHDLAAQQHGVDLATYLASIIASGEAQSGFGIKALAKVPQVKIETDITLSVAPPAELATKAAAHVAAGFRCLKVKLDARMDVLASMQAVRAAAGDQTVLRIDANQAFNASEAIRVIRALEDAGLNIELAEQPVPAGDWAGLAQVSAAVETPVLADESLWNLQDLEQLLRYQAAPMVNIKLAKTGGLRHGLRLLERATAEGIDVVIGCMLESHVGIGAAVALAAQLPASDGRSVADGRSGSDGRSAAQDLDGGLWLTASPVRGGIEYQGMNIQRSTAPGLGISGLALG
ncbi:enolase C-terminal domain-like protein [Pseudarthrobacter sp. J1763]|uniref:enolase C-terminal domain-like protein n=1 Tax=Pseudarthrobacter sp. J1763 TaxID=3420445 RepID=UPI003D2B3F5E